MNFEFEVFLKKIKNDIIDGKVWYGRYHCPEEPGMWLKMAPNDLPRNWEYKQKNSNIIFRKCDEDDMDIEDTDGCPDCMCEDCPKRDKCETLNILGELGEKL